MRENKPVVVFVINSLGLGGAERALSNILQTAPQQEEFDIHVVLLDTEKENRVLPEFVTVHRLDSRRSLMRSIYLLSRKLSQLKPTVCVSLLVRSNVANVIVNRLLNRRPAIICERMHLSSHLALQFSGAKLKLSKMIPSLLYRFASQALGVSTGVTNDLVQNFSVPKEKTLTIFNPYNLTQICQDGEKPNELALQRQYIVAVGRLTKSKNFTDLIKGYCESNCPYDLVILGDGEKHARAELQTLIDAMGVSEKVHLAGYAKNPFSVMKNAEFYISASLNEGFPNAMLEAMVLGLPVVASNCESGPAEILANDNELHISSMYRAKYGLLVPIKSVTSLTSAINEMSNAETQLHYAQMSLLRSKDFEIHKIANEYWQNFRSFMS
ncbi:glycosyltransferase [Paraglaciecola sp. 20A4]|uniref:glycosyltransferase n=1 Tax=Paraglaciecola sp. 20A4 TaxID=2687288 RepID=UPI001407B9D5|nr:glycosyltransferase [Paraglaciecola sp. 20A4]